MYKSLLSCLLIFIIQLGGAHPAPGQEEEQTPSQKTKEALKRLSKFPGAVQQRLQAARDKVRGALEGAEREPSRAQSAEKDSLAVPKASEKSDGSRYTPGIRRDPFVPLPAKTENQKAKRPLSPLEQFELAQLKLVGIVWDSKEPKAMVEDTSGLGYIIKIGTPIGANEGKVKAIKPDEVVIEEHYTDFYGARKSREFNMKLPVE
jgi:type IV pilus assembly protein PilP